MILWAAGVRASPLGASLAQQVGISTDSAGRAPVEPDLTLPRHPEIFIIGDLARVIQDGKPFSGVAPVAMQGGVYVAAVLRKRMKNSRYRPRPFRYRDKGAMTMVGRSYAIVQ